MYLQAKQPRGDYRELLELVVIYLGGVLALPYNFKKPGALSKTRWMARAIYALKTWMFGRQLKLTKADDSNLLKLCVFVCRVYICMWFKAPLANQAPRNDLLFLQKLYALRNTGAQWMAALNKFASHLWYLSPRLAILGLFDDEVSLQQKRKMVNALREKDGDQEPTFRAKVNLDRYITDLDLAHFVSKESIHFFTATGLSSKFLEVDFVC